MIRGRPVLAIARRDLARETRGRRGWLLYAVSAVILLPCATIPAERPDPPTRTWIVGGDVPPEVAAIERVKVRDKGRVMLDFRREGEQLRVKGFVVPDDVREALDAGSPEVPRVDVREERRWPRRSLILAMLSASLITGSVSASIAGERSQRTLETLLAAAVTRAEVVVGKWLAWSLYGAISGLVAALVAVGLGRLSLGWWLLPFPFVAAGTVALGLYLVRRTGDVVSSATTSMRILPAVLGGSGLLAWFLSWDGDLTGAFVPLGGALVAAGALWDDPLPALIATAITGLVTAWLLWRTVRDLERPASFSASVVRRLLVALSIALLASFAWVSCVAGPVLWAAAGNPALTDDLRPAAGTLAASFGLALIALAWATREGDPLGALGLRRGPGLAWALAPVAAIGVAAASAAGAIGAPPESPAVAAAATRLAAALDPVHHGVVVLVLGVLAQEALFRGLLQRLVGAGVATVVFAVALSPLDPVRGLLLAAPLAALVHLGGSIGPALLARLLAVALLPMLPAWGGIATAALVLATSLVPILLAVRRESAVSSK